MCGRYSLALRPSQVREYLENEHMPVFDAPEDEGEQAPRQTYNFAPGNHGIVYRADVPDEGAGRRQHEGKESEISEPETVGEIRYKLQSMKWGLIPFWTKRNPDYGSMMKTINCRDDSLIENKGMWTTMKQRKRCIVVAQGFYEWLQKGKEKIPHYVKRKDEKLMYFAGLWDCVQYEGEDQKHYTYTIITTSSNKQLNFLHTRMPVILENGSEEVRTWLDPKRSTWSKELQSLLKPFEGKLEVYPVSKEVGKVGNNSPNFIIPVASSENKSNIANFFAKGPTKKESGATAEPSMASKEEAERKEAMEEDSKTEKVTQPGKPNKDEDRKTIDHNGTEDYAPLPIPKEESKKGIKRELDDVPTDEPRKRTLRTPATPSKASSPPTKPGRQKRSATSNNTASPSKSNKATGSQKITNFFVK